jgi:hypothetical protein
MLMRTHDWGREKLSARIRYAVRVTQLSQVAQAASQAAYTQEGRAGLIRSRAGLGHTHSRTTLVPYYNKGNTRQVQVK